MTEEFYFRLINEDNSGSLGFMIKLIIATLDSNKISQAIFRIFDKNGDNLVDLNELSNFFRVYF